MSDFKTILKYPLEELKRLQALSLEDKVTLSKVRIQEWYENWDGKVCVNFSGGKDSTVLLHLVRSLYPEVPAVYVDNGMDLKTVREFVKRTPNVVKLKPEMNFRQVIEKCGWVFPSKDVAQMVEAAKRGVRYGEMYLQGKNADGRPSVVKEDRYARWRHLLNAPFKISPKCCDELKEKPLAKYHRETGQKPYVGLLASESKRRQQSWQRAGCNAFDSASPKSRPLMFWTEQDILRYIRDENLPIAEAYGEIIEKKGKLETACEHRTGCIFCLIGAHRDKPNRIQRLKYLEPEKYRYCLEQLGMREVLEWLKIPY